MPLDCGGNCSGGYIIYARGGYNFFDGIGWAGADWAGVGWGVMVRTCTLTVTSAHM